VFSKKQNSGYRDALDGVSYKTLVYGKLTSLSEFRLKKDSIIPNHSHPHEQTGYMISGKMTMSIEGKKFDVTPGDSWNIPDKVEHGVEVHEDSIVIEVFAPVREEYL
jgi:quercetin dioxygenase-like cupin family protein